MMDWCYRYPDDARTFATWSIKMMDWNSNGKSYLTEQERERVIETGEPECAAGVLRRDDGNGIWLDFHDASVEARLVGHAHDGEAAVLHDARTADDGIDHSDDIARLTAQIQEAHEREVRRLEELAHMRAELDEVLRARDVAAPSEKFDATIADKE